MRDSRRIQERAEVRLDRAQIVWLTLGGVVALGLMFALGVVVGRRAARFSEPQAKAADPIAQIDAQGDVHQQLTFYSKLTGPQSPSRAPAPLSPGAPPAAKPAVEPSSSTPASDGDIEAQLASGPAQSGEYTVQVSAFQTRSEAEAFAGALQRKGYKPFIVAASIPQHGTWYRVRLGRFLTAEQATQAKQLLARADIPAWVLRAE